MMEYLNFALKYPFFSLAVFVCVCWAALEIVDGIANIVRAWRSGK